MTAVSHPLANYQVPATGGMMDVYLSKPTGQPKAVVLMQVELWGLTQHMVEVADRLAAAGYVAVACDLFRGVAPPTPNDPVEKWTTHFEAFDDIRCNLDCRHVLNWVLTESEFKNLGVFAWGFCMGGRFAHNLAAFDSRLTAAINFYGRVNFPRSDNKPFLPIEVTRMIEQPYLGIFAESDDLIPDHDLTRMKSDFSSNDAATIEVYVGAQHAFFNDHRDAYNADAAQKAWSAVLDFLKRHG